MDARKVNEEKNSDQEGEIISSKCCRPKAQPDPNKKYPPMKFNSAPVKYDPEHHMYFFSVPDKNSSISDKNSSISEREDEEHNQMCKIL